MNVFELPRCSCGRERHPFADGRFVVGLFGVGCVLLCRWCDAQSFGPWPVMMMWSDLAWSELEMLERGSWPRRVADLIDRHEWHPNCRCAVFPQVDSPDNPD